RLTGLRSIHLDDGAKLQDLSYTYDPVGNIVQIRDNAQDTVYHSNQCVLPGSEYSYDALYRLVAASGRVHEDGAWQVGYNDSRRFVPSLPNDGHALQNYVETYRYDSVGNIMQMKHFKGPDIDKPGLVLWNRRYQYALDNNRLLATCLPSDP